MSAHTCSTSPVAVSRATATHAFGNLAGWLWSCYLGYRARNRLRRLAVDLDEHMLQDVGAPDWLVSEATVNRELARLRDANYLRW